MELIYKITEIAWMMSVGLCAMVWVVEKFIQRKRADKR